MTIDLANILDRFLPLKTLEMAFQSIKLSKCMGRACPQNPPRGSFLQRLPEFVGDYNTLLYI